MPLKQKCTLSKSSCERVDKQTKPEINGRKIVTPKKVVPSKQLHFKEKCCSTGGIYDKPQKPLKKSTQSDFNIIRKPNRKIFPKNIDLCHKCGDTICKTETAIDNVHKAEKNNTKTLLVNITKELTKSDADPITRSLEQYYKNKNYKSSESIRDIDTIKKSAILETIKEMTECDVSDSDLFCIYSDLESDGVKVAESVNEDNLRKLVKFRNNNYFECHSIRNRIENKPSATNLKDHKCGYRFYLNDRLFPTPLCTDHKNTIRCVECHLPLNENEDNKNNIKNATIQAKVKLGGETQDMMLLLPAKEPLIIKQRRKQSKVEEEVMYFGVIKLSANGHSVFNPTLPSNSLALRYQKGFQEFEDLSALTYEKVDKNDVILI